MGFDDDAVQEKKAPEFSFEEEKGSNKNIFVVYGKKGEGKTTVAFSIPGKKIVLSFDNKSILVRENYFDNDPNIKVYDATKYLSLHPDKFTQSSNTTIKYLEALLESVKDDDIDYIVIDGYEIFTSIAEMSMRYRQGIKPYAGIANLNVWKERHGIIRSIHDAAFRIAKKGLIYTTYIKEQELIHEGQVISRKEFPKWGETVLWVSDIILYAYSEGTKEGRKFYAEVVSSKRDKLLLTGTILDMTGIKDIRIAKKQTPKM